MMVFVLYLLAILALAVGTAAIHMALIQPIPAEWLYYHYFLRKPLAWTIFVSSLFWVAVVTWQTGTFPLGTLLPLILIGLAVVLAHKVHQSNVFQAVNFPSMTEEIAALPLQDEMQLAVIEVDGVTKAFPLDYVVHHHIVNDRFGQRIIALTYCAMCRSIIPFDVTEIGPLFVGSYKNANMIVADQKTKTFFQQATFESIIGKLHPHTLMMVPYQILAWHEVKNLSPRPQVVKVTAEELGEFRLPVPGVWRKILASEVTPGLAADARDKSFPARTRVVGVTDSIAQSQIVYLKEELLTQGVVNQDDPNIVLVAVNDTVNGFKRAMNGRNLDIILNPDTTLTDSTSATVWDIRGKYLRGEIRANLTPIAISDEYWFSWRRFHPTSTLIRV